VPWRDDERQRRGVVPDAAGRSLWLAATWTGVGAAVVCATIAVVAVAVCWLPTSGASGHTGSAIRIGLVTFLAGLHGGVTIDGTRAMFLPLGMLAIVALTAWRAGCALGDTAVELDETEPGRLLQAAAAQAGAFTVAALVISRFATVGTSSAPIIGLVPAGFGVVVLAGGAGLARCSDLGAWLVDTAPAVLRRGLRVAAAALGGYLVVAALLVAGSLALHHAQVEALSRQVGAGWGGVPVLLLGVLAVPNAVIAAASYVAGPGFAVGAGSTVSATSTVHGVVPAFPLLGALPTGHGATWPVLAVMALTALGVAALGAWSAWPAGTWRGRFSAVAVGAPLAGVAMSVLAWQGGGGIGDGRLRVVGASPALAGLAVGVEVAVLGALGLAATAAWQSVRRSRDEADARPALRVIADPADAPSEAPADSADAPQTTGTAPEERGKGGKLAG
jgi:hypothetical protein